MLAGNSAYVPPSFESIASATGTGSSGTINFTSIPSTYQHLQIRALVRFTNGATAAATTFQIQFNSDTGANYAFHLLYGTGASASTGNSTSETFISSGYVVPYNAVSSNTMGVIIIDIHDYKSTTRNKTVRTFGGCDNNSGDNNFAVNLTSGLYMSTSAIDSIQLKNGAGNWTTTTQFALYGIRG